MSRLFVKCGLTNSLTFLPTIEHVRRGNLMNENLKKIHDYLLCLGVTQENIAKGDASTVNLADEIAEYAHRNQKRENGERYSDHPWRVLDNYRKFVGIIPDDCFCIDKDTMWKHGIPFQGVQEVCLLHDVIEDTEFGLGDIKAIYVECHFKDYFELYMEEALRCITHDKSEDYMKYIHICLKNPASAIVKMMDLQDNLRVVDLVSLDDEKLKRSVDYLFYIRVINDACHFLEGGKAYREEFAERQRKFQERMEQYS